MRRGVAVVGLVVIVLAAVFLVLAWRDSGGAGVAEPPAPADAELSTPDVVAADALPVWVDEPEPIPAAPSWSLPDVLVTVVDAQGARVAQATVTATRGERPVATASTDEAGTCRLGMAEAPSGRCLLRAEKAELRSLPLEARAGEAVVLRLLETRSFVLRVVDDVSGEGLPGCAIHVYGQDDWVRRIADAERFVTQEDGICRASGILPIGALLLRRPGYVARQLDDPPGEVLGESEFVIRLSPAPVLRVHLHDAQGQEIAGATFGEEDWARDFIAAPCRVATESGRMVYEVSLDPERGGEVRADGWATQSLVIPRSLDPGPVLDVEMRPGAAVVGRIENGNQLSLPSVRVRLRAEAREQGPHRAKDSFHGPVGDDGTFRVEGLQRGGDYYLGVFEEWLPIQDLQFSVGDDQEVVDLGLIDVTALSEMDKTVSGVVSDVGGGPLAGAWVAGGRQHTSSDSKGCFTLRTAADAASVWVWKEGYEPVSSRVSVGQSALIALRPAGSIHGQVLDDRGLPVAFARVNLFSDSYRGGPRGPALMPRAWTDDRGNFVIGRGGLGQDVLQVDAAGFFPASKEVPAGESLLLVRLARSVQLRAELGPDLEPAPGSQWRVHESKGFPRWWVVPGGERFFWMRVPVGTCHVLVDVPGHKPVEMDVQVSAEGPNVVRVDAQDG